MTDIDVEVMKKALLDTEMMFLEISGLVSGIQVGGIEQSLGYEIRGLGTTDRNKTRNEIALSLFHERIARLKRGENGEYIRDTQGNPVLESTFEKVLKEMSEERSWRLLERELGTTDFQTFQRSGLVTLRASNGKDFSITKRGEVTIHTRSLMGKKTIEGVIGFTDKYPVADCLWTLVKWIKADPEVVEETIVKHCGMIYLNGGEIAV